MPPFSRRANGEIGNAHDPPLIFLINTNLDTVEMLKLVFEKSGFQAAGCLARDLRSGVVAIDAVCEQLHPSAVVYDIGPPYDREWQYLQEVLRQPACASIPFVVTTTNADRLRRVAGVDEPILELFTKPYDLQQLVEVVCRAVSRRRPAGTTPEPAP